MFALWGGVRGGRKICWVKWSVVCRDKKLGGLGVRDVRIVNLSLLSKWRWRLLQPRMPLWKKVLVAKYGRHILHHVDWSDYGVPSSSSYWWKDICALDSVVVSNNWLVEALTRVVGNGRSTYFWLSRWLGDAPLAVVFPRLFSLSMHKEGMVHDFFKREGDLWNWDFRWRRDLFQWELDLVASLRDRLKLVSLSSEVDVWMWVLDPE
jgi:hypothetical protein